MASATWRFATAPTGSPPRASCSTGRRRSDSRREWREPRSGCAPRDCSLGDEVEGVRQLVGTDRVAAGEVGLLVADVDDDPVAVAFDVAAGAALVLDHGVLAAWVEDQPLPARVAGAGQVGLGCALERGRAA